MKRLMVATGFVLALFGTGETGQGAEAGLVRTGEKLPKARISFVDSKDHAPGLVLVVYLKTDLKKAWDLLSDPRCGAKLFSNVKSITPVDLDRGLWRFTLDSLIGEKTIVCRVVVDHESHTVRWRRVRGDLRTFEGYWKLVPSSKYGGHIKAEYGSFIDPGGIGRLFLTDTRRKNMVLDMLPRLHGSLRP